MAGDLAAPAALAALFGGLFVAERVRPLRRRVRPGAPRLWVNGVLTVLVFATGTFAVKLIALHTARLAGDAGFGLLRWLPLGGTATLAAGLLLMDLTFYYWHRANHRLGLLWRFHNVHHIDPDLDVSTSFRFHPGEILYSVAFRVAQVGLLGVAPLTYLVYETTFTAATMFHHSNLRLPRWLARPLSAVLVTPRMHGIHHSQVRDETHANYGVVVRWWDWLHRSLRTGIPQHRIDIGVPAYTHPADNALRSLLPMPFRPQRDYWRRPDGTASTRRRTAPIGA